MYGYPLPALSRAASPTPSAGSGAMASSYMQRSPSVNDFQIEKVARTPAAKRFPLPSDPGSAYTRDEQAFRDSAARFLDVKNRQFAAYGRIPVDCSQLVLFFRSKSGITHSLDFPINVLEDTPPALDVLIAACRPHQTSDLDAYEDRESLFFPPNLPLTTSLEIANHPILDGVRNALFPDLPPEHHLTVMRDKLEVVVSGGRMGRQPISLRNDGRSATLIVTLPVRYRGGAIVIHEPSQNEQERITGRGGKNGDLDWVAFIGNCDYEIETVQSGCRVSISYGVYLKNFLRPPPTGIVTPSDALMTPSDRFFDLLSPILNATRGKKIGFFMNHSYDADPSEVLAESLIPTLKGGDALLHEAFRMYKLQPEMHWTAGGYIWPMDLTIQFPTDDITNTHSRPLLSTNRMNAFNVHRGIGSPTQGRVGIPPVRGAFSNYGGEVEENQGDLLRAKVEESGGIPLAEADIHVLVDWINQLGGKSLPGVNHPVGVQHVYFVSGGELEKLVVNALLVVYVP